MWMPFLHASLLAAILALLAWRTVRNQQATIAFKALNETRDRQRAFKTKFWQSLLMFGGGGVAVLVLIGRSDALWSFPAEFAALQPDGKAAFADHPLAHLAGILIGLTAASLTVYAVWRFVLGRRSQPVVGAVSHLFPRNQKEAVLLVPRAINAGVSEEIMFRLALPLLATLATGSATLGFAISAITFGLMHWYQGWRGVIITGLSSYLFISIYMQFGSLLAPIALHAAIDLLALVVRPAISLRLDRSKSDSDAQVELP